MLRIVESPDPILSTVCEPCDLADKELKRLAKQMQHAMYKHSGCGIAAPQVGVTKRLVVIDVDWDGDKGEKNPIVLVNPEVVELRGEPEVGGEGCLSCPGVNVAVARQPWARVRYLDLDGEAWEIDGDGLLGRCLQHEIDHLDGKTLFEACDPKIRLEALTIYERARAAGAKPGDTDFSVGLPDQQAGAGPADDAEE